MYIYAALLLIFFIVWLMIVIIKHDFERVIDENPPQPGNESKNEAPQPKPDHSAARSAFSYIHEPDAKKKDFPRTAVSTNADETEVYVTRSLSGLGHNYIIFTNLIIDKPGLIKTTEIDHVVISPYGIFCIETKSHGGSIYGSAASKEWQQYLQGVAYPLYSPLFQNSTHAKALSLLLAPQLKSKVHSFVVFPNANKVKVNSSSVFRDIKKLIAVIDAHQKVVYRHQELTDIAYILAKYTKQYDRLIGEHTQNVHEYLLGAKS